MFFYGFQRRYNATYTIENNLAPVGRGNPSKASDVHGLIEFDCRHNGSSIVTASGRVDDDVEILTPGINCPGG